MVARRSMTASFSRLSHSHCHQRECCIVGENWGGGEGGGEVEISEVYCLPGLRPSFGALTAYTISRNRGDYRLRLRF